MRISNLHERGVYQIVHNALHFVLHPYSQQCPRQSINNILWFLSRHFDRAEELLDPNMHLRRRIFIRKSSFAQLTERLMLFITRPEQLQFLEDISQCRQP